VGKFGISKKNDIKLRWIFLASLAVGAPSILYLSLAAEIMAVDDRGDETSEPFFGHTKTEWVIQWLKWMMQFPADNSPDLDQTGNLTMKYQPNTLVYMLAGEHSSFAPNRHVTVSADKPIMMPVLFHLVGTFSDNQEAFRREANSLLAQKPATKLVATLDDKPLPITTITTPVFKLHIPENNFLEIKNSGDANVICKGYWVFMHPLSPGNYTIFYTGAMRDYFNGARTHLKVDSTQAST
jgi:hypothetical protein